MTTILLLSVIGALAVTALTHHRLTQPGLVVVVLAGAISFIPGVPRFELEPHLILGLVMPPLLYSATINASMVGFVRNLRAIVALGVGLVVVTTLAVGGLTALLVPSIGFGVALVLAAIVSPPDTVTVVTRGREIGLPSRVTSILTGESLVNDATALTIITIAITATTGGHALFDSPLLLFGYGIAVGAVLGVLIGMLVLVVRRQLGNPALENAFTLLVPFAAYFVAEELHASGVIAVVVAAFAIRGNTDFDENWQGPTSYLTRLQERQLWPVVDALLEAFVFAYMGLQLSYIVDDLRFRSEDEPWRIVALGLAVLVAVIVVRFAWVFLVFGRWKLKLQFHEKRYASSEVYRRFWDRRVEQRAERRRQREQANTRGRGPSRPSNRTHTRDLGTIGWREMVLVSWTGMRGIVTLAAAASIPAMSHGEPFPDRPAIQVVAFIVAVGTLLLQGATLPFLARRLDLDLTGEANDAAEQLALGRTLLDAHDIRAFDDRRTAIRHAVMTGELDDVVGSELLASIDLDQAAIATRD